MLLNIFILYFRSRLGCQIQLTKDLDGLEVQLPTTINDVRAQWLHYYLIVVQFNSVDKIAKYVYGFTFVR